MGEELNAHGQPICGARSKQTGRPCQQKAGWGTDHVGEGRCKLHGGARPIKHGRYSRIKRRRVAEIMREIETSTDAPGDLEPEMNLLRALVIDYVERYDEFTDGIIRWHASWTDAYQSARAEWMQAVERATAPRITTVQQRTRAALDRLRAHVERHHSSSDVPTTLERAIDLVAIAATEIDVTAATIPTPPDPATYENRPRQLLDVSAAATLIDKIGRLSDRMHKRRQAGSITLEQANRAFSQMALDVEAAVREVIEDDATATKILASIDQRWAGIALDAPPPDRSSRAKELN